MGIYPKKYTKEEFIVFLKKNNVNETIINEFEKLPKKIKRNDNVFKLDLDTTWYSIGDTYYNFDINYYSEDLVEYLFSSKVFNNIEVTINRIRCELKRNKQIKIIE